MRGRIYVFSSFMCIMHKYVSLNFAINLDSVNCDDFNKENNKLKLAGGPIIKIMDKDIICNRIYNNSIYIYCKKGL